MKKKVCSILLALSMASGILSGCGTNQTTSQGSIESQESESGQTSLDASVETKESTTTTAGLPVEIEFWHALGGDLGDALNEIIENYNTSQSAYVVKPVVVGSYDEIDQKLQAAYAANQVPALVAGGSYDTFYQKGLTEAVEDYLPESYNKEDIVGGFMDAAVRDGKMQFAPAYGTSQVLYYNKAVLKEAGYSSKDLSSWQSLEALKTKIVGTSTGTESIAYIWEPMWGYNNMIDVVSSAGGTFLSEDKKTVLINDETWVEVFEQFRKWIHEDGSMNIHSGGQGWEYWYKTMDDWTNGIALGYTGSPGDYTIAYEAVTKAAESGVKNEFAVAVQPGWKENAPAPYFGSHMFYIPKGSNLSDEQKKGAADFITFATNTENTAKFSMGTGYVAVRKSVLENEEYKAYLEQNPDADVALKQIDEYAVPEFIDPTGGAITQALSDATDRIQIENISAKEALDEAQKIAQDALDQVN